LSLEQSSGLRDDHVEHHVLAVIEHLSVADPVDPVEDSGAVASHTSAFDPKRTFHRSDFKPKSV
jgi:hypothetical protein